MQGTAREYTGDAHVKDLWKIWSAILIQTSRKSCPRLQFLPSVSSHNVVGEAWLLFCYLTNHFMA